jgi:hypothetical protein
MSVLWINELRDGMHPFPDAQNMIDYVAVSEKTRNVIDYIVACVNEFSDAHDMDCVSGFDYLHTHNGVTFLERNYDVEHSYPIEDTVQSLASVCRHNGGTL